MSFAKEDKAAWLSSEIMQEFEKIAQEQGVLDGPPPEAFQPIAKEAKEDESWEDENVEKALNEPKLNANNVKMEFHLAYNNNLFSNLEKLAHQLAEKSNIKAAYRVEQTLYKLKDYVSHIADNNIKEAAMELTPQQMQIVKSIALNKQVNWETALEYAKDRYSRLFSEDPLPAPTKLPSKELAWKPKVPEWTKEKDPWDPKSWGIEEPAPGTAAGKEPIAPDGGDIMEDIQKKMQEDYPEFNFNDDGAFASVINELTSLANDLENLGEEKTAIAIDEQTKIYKEAVDKLYDVTGETGDELVGQAHPGGGPTLFQAKEDGGKVETIVEEHKKSVEKATKNPTGKYAEVMAKLVATANKLEDDGEIEAAMIVDKTILKLKEAAETPPKKYSETGAKNRSDYADSKNYKYPIHTEKNVRSALSYFSNSKNYGEYSIQERSKIWSRIKSAAKKYNIELNKDNDPPWSKKAKAGATSPFVNRGTAVEAAGSKDLAASIIREGKYDKLIPIWDTIINSMWNPLYEEIVNTRPSIVRVNDNKSDFAKQRYVAAENLKDRISDGWHDLNNIKLSSLVDKMAKALMMGEYGQQTFTTMNDIFTRTSTAEKYARMHDKMVAALKVLAKKFANIGEAEGSKGDGKTETTVPFNVKDKELKRYQSTLDKIISGLQSDYGNAKKILRGAVAVGNLIKSFEKEKVDSAQYDAAKVENRNKYVYQLLRILKSKGIKIDASDMPTGVLKITQADAFTDSMKSLMKSLAPTKKRTPGRTSKRPGGTLKGDPEVSDLQTALKNAGFNPGTVDGTWGRNTASAYNQFIASVEGMERSLKPVANPNRQKPQDKSAIDLKKAIQLVEYVAGKRKDKGSTIIPLSAGITVPLNAMRSSRTFVEYMQSAINFSEFPPDLAMKYLKEILDYTNENEYDMESKKRGSVNMWKTQINKLNREFQNYARQEKVAPKETGSGELKDPWAGEKKKTGYAYPWERPGTANRVPISKRDQGMGTENDLPGLGGFKTSARAVWTLLTKLPPVTQIKDPEMFESFASHKEKTNRQYFEILKKQLRDAHAAWAQVSRQGMISALGKSNAQQAEEFIVNYFSAISYIKENSEKFFTNDKPKPAPKARPAPQVAPAQQQQQRAPERRPLPPKYPWGNNPDGGLEYDLYE